MPNNIYDPSDICNNINGFNIVECSTFKDVDIYICIPNLGYGFLANVMNSFTDKYSSITPGSRFSASRTVSSSTVSRENNKFVLVGEGMNPDFMVIKVPGNNICSDEYTVTEPLILPIPVKVRNTAGTSPNVLSEPVMDDANLACYSMMAHTISSGYSEIETKTAMQLVKEILTAECIRNAAAVGISDTYDTIWKFTGDGTSGSRIEFSDMATRAGNDKGVHYFDIVKGTNVSEFSKCFLMPSVYVSFDIGSSMKRICYSPTLTKTVIPAIKIKGKATPPKVEISRVTTFLGVSADDRASVLGSEYISTITSGEISSFTGFSPYEYVLTGSVAGREIAYGGYNLSSNVMTQGLKVLRNGAETEVTISLIVPTPPLFNMGDIYSDDPTGEGDMFIPFTQSYILPIAAYSKSGADLEEDCMFCGKTGKVGLSICPVCAGTGSIRCPRCLHNIEQTDNNEYGFVKGYISEECPACNSKGNEYVWKEYEAHGLMTGKVGYEPCDCAKRAFSAYVDMGGNIGSFSVNLGRVPKGAGICKSCGGSGMVKCTECVASPLYNSPRPGIRRTNCEVCNEKTAPNYLGHDTPKPGYIKCSSESLAKLAGTPCEQYYSEFLVQGVTTCGGTGKVEQENCPACAGATRSYRFRSVDLDTSVSAVDEEFDKGDKYTIEDSHYREFKYTYKGKEFQIYGLPHKVVIPMKNLNGPLVSIYIRIPYYIAKKMNPEDRWLEDTYYNPVGDALMFKWLPKTYYNLDKGNIVIFADLPVGSEILVFSYPAHDVTGSRQDRGYYLLDSRSQYPEIASDTVYEGTWCYYPTVDGVPIYSTLGPVHPNMIQDLTYKTYDDNETYLYSDGFAHLMHSTSRYINLITYQKDAMRYIMTSGYDGKVESGITSRFVCIDKNDPKLSTMLNFKSLSDYTDLPLHMKISQSTVEKSVNELAAKRAVDLEDQMKHPERYSSATDGYLKKTIWSMSDLMNIRAVERTSERMYPYVTKTTASGIKSNSSSTDASVATGSEIESVTQTSLPSDVNLDNSVMLVGQINKVTIADDNSISVASIIESSSSVPEGEIYTIIDSLLKAINTSSSDIYSSITDVLMKVDMDDSKSLTFKSPKVSFSSSLASFVCYEETLSSTIESLKSFLAVSDQNGQDKMNKFMSYVSLLATGEVSETPSDFESTMSWISSFLYSKSLSIAGLMTALQVTMPDDSNIFLVNLTTGSGATTSSKLASIMFDPQAYRKGLLVYNMKKAYMLLISSLSYLCAVVERLFTYTIYIMNRLDPGTCEKETIEKNLIIHGFKGSDGKLCFPEVASDIAIPGGLVNSTVKLNHLTRIVTDEKIAYEYEIDISDPGSSTDVYAVPMLGMGVSDEIAEELGSSDHAKPYVNGNDSAGYAMMETTGEDAYEIPEPDVFRDVKANISFNDYMIYTESGIKYLYNGTVKEYSTNITSLEADLIESNTYSLPELTKVKVKGKIDMGTMFTYQSPGVTFDIPNPKFSVTALEFAESHPRTVLDKIRANHIFVNPTVSGGKITTLFDPKSFSTQVEIIQEGVSSLITFMENPYILHRLYNMFKSYESALYCIYFIGGASTTLSVASNHGESMLMNMLFDEAGISGLTTTTATVAAEMYDSANAYWTSHTLTDDNARTVIKDRNFNLWLSKRMAYNTFVMYMSEIYCRSLRSEYGKDNIPSAKLYEDMVAGTIMHQKTVTFVKFDTGDKVKYTMTLVYVDSKSQLSLTSTQIAFQPFHCYGFGSLLQVTDEGDFNTSTRTARRDKQRMVHVLGAENIEAGVNKLQGIEHLNPSEFRKLPLGGDFDSGVRVSPVGSFKGSWYNPNVGADGNWYTNVTVDNAYQGNGLNSRTRTGVGNMIAMSKGASASESEITLVHEYCMNQNNSHTMNTILKNFIKTQEGMQAFSVPRNEGSLTSKIWMIITKA